MGKRQDLTPSPLDTTGLTARASPSNIPALDVIVMADGGLTSLDNRRLTAAQLYNAENVQVRIHAYGDLLPTQTNADMDNIRRLSHQDKSGTKWVPESWGDAVEIRMYKQNEMSGGKDFFETFRFGSPVIPRIYNAPDTPLYRPYLTPPTRRR
jgi:hypothetical protein